MPDTVFEEIRQHVRGYDIPVPVIATGGAAQTMPVNGRIAVTPRPDLVRSDHNGLFDSGTLGRYSKVLNSVLESHQPQESRQPRMSHLLDNYYIIALIKILIVVAVLMHVLAYLQWVERKVIAHVQVRPGPYNVGWHGLLQPLADVIKLITKEDMMPPYANTFLLPVGAVPRGVHGAALHRRDSLRPQSMSPAIPPGCSLPI